MTEKRDESMDVWILGNWCGQYILHEDSSIENKNAATRYVPARDLESALARVRELEAMLVPHPGETWDSDKPPIQERVYELFAALSQLGTQDDTEPFRSTLRTLLCNRDTLATRVRELETAARCLLNSIGSVGVLSNHGIVAEYRRLEALLAKDPTDA